MPGPETAKGTAATRKAPAQPRAGVAETHVAVVFFAGDRAYKLKKPLDLGFLDFRSREARLVACRREVELGRRLAPDVYLGVADVTGPQGELCDHLVIMRRMPPARRLASLALAGEPLSDQMRQLARLLAAFHARAATSPGIAQAAGRDALAGRWEENAKEMARFAGVIFNTAAAERIIALARRYLAGRQALFDERVAAGRARDGHGDLIAEDIFLLDDGPRVLDCLEFDDALRWDDVLADVSFLAMDLERLGRPGLAARFLAAYREFSGDNWPASLEHHHVAYRAQVRAKVAALAWEQAAGDGTTQQEIARDAEHLLHMSLAHLEAGRVRLIVIGGLPGTGKSTLAVPVAEALGAALIRSDEVRKQLAGMDTTAGAPAPFGQGLYQPEMTAATYREVLARARAVLARGESVVADASWHDPGWREQARTLAGETFADLTELRCELPVSLIAERVAGRARAGSGASDATTAIVRQLAASQQPWPSAITVDTTPSPTEVAGHALKILGLPGEAAA